MTLPEIGETHPEWPHMFVRLKARWWLRPAIACVALASLFVRKGKREAFIDKWAPRVAHWSVVVWTEK